MVSIRISTPDHRTAFLGPKVFDRVPPYMKPSELTPIRTALYMLVTLPR